MPVERLDPAYLTSTPEAEPVSFPLKEPLELEAQEEEAEGEVLPGGDFDANLAETLPEDVLKEIAQNVIGGFKSDKESRAEHEKVIEQGIKLLGIKAEEAVDPFPGACNATHPLIIESAVKFQSKAIQEIYPPSGPIKTQIVGTENEEKVHKAARIKSFMDYQLLEQIPEYFDDDERLLFTLPIVGTAIKKPYWDGVAKRPRAEVIPFDQFHISYWATSLEDADRYTHIIYVSPHELKRRQLAGMYLDIDLGKPARPEVTNLQQTIDKTTGRERPQEQYNSKYTLLEQHTYINITEDEYNVEGIDLPYVVTVDEKSQKVISIRRNWVDGDPAYKKVVWFVHYKYVPGFGFYGLGLPHLVGNFTLAATAALRSLTDAGQFATLPAGFKAKGVRVAGNFNDPFAPGEWREVEAVGTDINKSFVPLPYKEPSVTLFQMLQFLDERGQRFADSTEQVIADSTNYGPVGTTLALLEASTKFYASVYKRLHKSKRDEYRILYRLNSWYLDEEYPYDVEGGDRTIFRADFDGTVDVLPVSDPNVPSMAHRLAKASTQLEMALKLPQIHDMREAARRFYVALDVKEIDKLLPPPPQAFTGDPVSENMMMMMGRPVQASRSQDHAAHIGTHKAFAEDPNFGGSDISPEVKMAELAHIKEHMAFMYLEMMEKTLGYRLPVGEQLPPQMEIPLSQEELAAGAAIRGYTQSQDPTQVMAQVEMMKAVTGARAQDAKEEKDVAELAVKMRDQDLKELELRMKAAAEGFKLKGKIDETIIKETAANAREKVKAASAETISRNKPKPESR